MELQHALTSKESKKLHTLSFRKVSIPGNVSTTSSDDYAKWTKVDTAVDGILLDTSVVYNFEELSREIGNIMRSGTSMNLYKRMDSRIKAYVQSKIPSFQEDGERGSLFLKKVASSWNIFCSKMLIVRGILLYIDSNVWSVCPDHLCFWSLCTTIFRTYLIANQVTSKIQSTTLDEIMKERQGVLIDKSLVRSITRLLIDLELYTTWLEPDYLAQTEVFFTKEGNHEMSVRSIPDYILYVSARLAEETARNETYFYCEYHTRTTIQSIIISKLLSNQLPVLIDVGLFEMLDDQLTELLSTLYSLSRRVTLGDAAGSSVASSAEDAEVQLSYCGSDKLREGFAKYIKSRGYAIIDNPYNDPDKDKNMISKLLEFKDYIDHLVVACFCNDATFNRAVQDSFEEFINKRPNKPAEYLAKYINGKLRSGNKGATEEQLEEDMNKVITVFRFIEGKDIFEAFYAKDLAKRLLMSKSASIDAEEAMLAKLKQECGPNYTRNMQGMFGDIDNSATLSRQFRDSASSQKHAIELSVNVICSGTWPSFVGSRLVYPSQMLSLQKDYMTFYCSHHSGRKLTFEPSLGSCILAGHFAKGKKNLQVSEYQAVVLLQFNKLADGQSIDYIDILKATGIEEKELKRTILCLTAGKGQQVLLKKPPGIVVNCTDTFQFNDKFTHKYTKIKFNQVQLKETVEEQQAIEEKVFSDRKSHVECVIVRIMKTKRKVEHAALIREVHDQLRFPYQSSEVKKRVENLIDRDFISRDKDKASLYHYVA